MEVEVSGSEPLTADGGTARGKTERDQVRVRLRTLHTVLDQCQRALELLGNTGDDDDIDGAKEGEVTDEKDSSSRCGDPEAIELCDLLKSRVESPNFLEKLENAQASVQQQMAVAEECNSWDVVSENDLWERGSLDEDEGYVLVRQEDIVDGIACFMATYLLSLKETKELTPNQLQEALSKTLSIKRKKGKIQKAWDGSKVLYNIASWGATAIGIYQNPALVSAASAAFWSSCRVISKLF